MGTLIHDSNTTDEVDKSKDLKDEKKLRKKIEKEYAKMRLHMEDVRQAYAYVESAQAYDDVYSRLRELERATRRVRKGRLMSRGSKAHKALLGKLKKMTVQ